MKIDSFVSHYGHLTVHPLIWSVMMLITGGNNISAWGGALAGMLLFPFHLIDANMIKSTPLKYSLSSELAW